MIGEELVQNITPKFIDQFYKQLKKTKSAAGLTRNMKSVYVT